MTRLQVQKWKRRMNYHKVTQFITIKTSPLLQLVVLIRFYSYDIKFFPKNRGSLSCLHSKTLAIKNMNWRNFSMAGLPHARAHVHFVHVQYNLSTGQSLMPHRREHDDIHFTRFFSDTILGFLCKKPSSTIRVSCGTM